MDKGTPTLQELFSRTREHREVRQDSDTVHLVWMGYLRALLEWQYLPEKDYEAVMSELRPLAQQELREPLFVFPKATLKGSRLPTENEFRSNIQKSLDKHGNSEKIKLIWRGYLAGLMEWSSVIFDEYHDLDEMLRPTGNDEISEIFLGFVDEDDEPQR